jgi:hypothetical protein
MGRPPIGKKAMTAAQRQRRRRRRLKVEAKRAENEERFRHSHANRPPSEPRPPPAPYEPPTREQLADGIATQVAEAVAANPDMLTIAEVLAAIKRRFCRRGL